VDVHLNSAKTGASLGRGGLRRGALGLSGQGAIARCECMCMKIIPHSIEQPGKMVVLYSIHKSREPKPRNVCRELEITKALLVRRDSNRRLAFRLASGELTRILSVLLKPGYVTGPDTILVSAGVSSPSSQAHQRTTLGESGSHPCTA
jgi:hypothetical protein